MNNISVTNSVVGTINTGSIETLDQSITALVQIGEPQISDAVKSLSEAILQSGDLTKNQRNELVEILSVIAKEASAPEKSRKHSVVFPLLERAATITGLAADISDLCQKYWPVLLAFFRASSS